MPLLTGLTGSLASASYDMFYPDKMVDDDNATVCMSWGPAGTGHWFQVDIGFVETVTEVEVRQGYTSTTDGNCYGAPVLEYSTDGSSWTVLHSQTTKSPQIIHVTGLSISARYLRIREAGASGDSWPTVQEFRVWGGAPDVPVGTLAAVLPAPVVAITGTAPTPGTLAVTLPVPTVSLAGDAPIPGILSVALPLLTFAGTGSTPPPRTGYGLALDSTATVSAPPPVDFTADPVDPAGVPAPVQHVVVPTVPAPVLVNGRPS